VRPIAIRGKPVADGKFPLVCAPLVARTRAELMAEAAIVLRTRPDVVEWRVDFFSKSAEVIDTARALKATLGSTPLLFTRRSASEGGEPSDLDAAGVVALYEAVCDARCADLVDFEMSNPAPDVAQVVGAAKRCGIATVLSYHNFRETPALALLVDRFATAQALGGDVAKVAVMPKRMDDVLVLLAATLEASESLRIPLISMSMGALGSLTRMFGWAFGSGLTFGIGASGSAPGQVAIEDLNAVIALARKAMQRG
jgi:3-dehydroquinate dehydratase-1